MKDYMHAKGHRSMTTHSLGHRGHRQDGKRSSFPFRVSMSRNPGNHSSISASTLSTTEHNSLWVEQWVEP